MLDDSRWDRRPLTRHGHPGPIRRVDVKFPPGALNDLRAMVRHHGTSASALIRRLLDDEKARLDRQEPDWRATRSANAD